MEYVEENCVIGLDEIEKKKKFLTKRKFLLGITFGTSFLIIIDIILINDFISILSSL